MVRELQTEGAAPPGKQSIHSTCTLFKYVPEKNNSMFVQTCFSFITIIIIIETTKHLNDGV